MNSSFLQVDKADSSDMGQFECLADNRLGNASIRYDVQLKAGIGVTFIASAIVFIVMVVLITLSIIGCSLFRRKPAVNESIRLKDTSK